MASIIRQLLRPFCSGAAWLYRKFTLCFQYVFFGSRWQESRLDAIFRKHVANLRSDAEQWQKAQPLKDCFPPQLGPDDGPLLVSQITWTVSIYLTPNVFIKRQAHKDELGVNMRGEPVILPYYATRLQIEAANLKFIAENTNIPVPKPLGVWQDEQNGLWYLKTSAVHGGVGVDDLDETVQPAAFASVDAQIQNEILPQLRCLRRNFIGSADPNLPVVPPRWAWKTDQKTYVWPSFPTNDDDSYVFCHTDLGPHNILVDPDTFRIVSIIDWETAGFFPPSWELPLWGTRDHLERSRVTLEAEKKEAIRIAEMEAALEKSKEKQASSQTA